MKCPVPLCLLQRIGFFAVGRRLLMNVVLGPKSAHYSFAIIAIIGGGATALRQISVHVIPGTPEYGAPFGPAFLDWGIYFIGCHRGGVSGHCRIFQAIQC